MNKQDARAIILAIEIKAKQVDKKPCPWVDSYRPHWVLRLDYAGRSSTFDFWNNVQNEPPLNEETGHSSKLNILSMILSDATSGLMDIDEFASEFGCTSVSAVVRAHQSCQKTRRKFLHLLSCTSDDLFDLESATSDLVE